jgi:hypothetical protein
MMRIRDFVVLASALLSTSAGDMRGPAWGKDVRRAPECPPSKGVLCIQDTAYVGHREGDGNIEAVGTVLWFGHRGDSLVLSAHASAVQTTIGDDKDAAHNNVPHFHGRIPKDGTMTIWTTMEEERGDSVRYTLRVEDMPGGPSSPGLEATGETARLILPSPSPQKFVEISVIPVSQLRPGIDRAAWKTYPGKHKVVLTRDSLYEVCRLPCVSPRTVKLRAEHAVTARY